MTTFLEDQVIAFLDSLADRGYISRGHLGYYYISTRKRKEAVKATMWLMEEAATGRLLMVTDREGMPMWYPNIKEKS